MATKKKSIKASESARELESSMKENQIPARPEGESVGVSVEGGEVKPIKRRQKQPELPEMKGDGVEKPCYPEFEAIVDDFMDKQDAWDKTKLPLANAKTKVVQFMKDNSFDRYTYGNTTVVLNPPGEEKVNVKRLADHSFKMIEED